MQFPFEITFKVNSPEKLFIETDQHVSNYGEDHSVLIQGFLAYYARTLNNLGENEFTLTILEFLSAVAYDFINHADPGYKSEFFMNEGFQLSDEPEKDAIELKCYLKEGSGTILVTSPWSRKVQKSENLGPILFLTLVTYLLYLEEVLNKEELTDLGLYIVGMHKYFEDVDGGYNNLKNIHFANKSCIEMVEEEKKNQLNNNYNEDNHSYVEDQRNLEQHTGENNSDSVNAIIAAVFGIFLSETIIVPCVAIYYGVKGYSRSQQLYGQGKVISIISIILGILYLIVGVFSWF